MIAISLLAAFLVLGVAADVEDFDDNHRGYEFIYHDTTNLILVIHGNNCYYCMVPDNLEQFVDDTRVFFISGRDMTEGHLRYRIDQNNDRYVKASSLDAMRAKYQDLLADFHCIDKNIFEIIESPSDSWSL